MLKCVLFLQNFADIQNHTVSSSSINSAITQIYGSFNSYRTPMTFTVIPVFSLTELKYRFK